MLTFRIRKGDRAKALLVQGRKFPSGELPDWSGFRSATFVMYDETGDAPKVDHAAATLDTDACTISYAWQDGDTDTVGTFRGMFRLTDGAGNYWHFPEQGDAPFIRVQVEEV